MNAMGRSSGGLSGAGIRSNDRRRPGSICTNGRPPWFVSPPAVLAFLVSWCQRDTQRGQACGSVPKKGEKGGPLALPSQGRQAHSLGRGLFSPLPKLAPLAVAPHPPSFTNHRRQVHAQHAQHRRGRSPSSPRLLHHARLFFEEFRIMAVARCLCALLALAVAPAPATAQMTVDLTSRGEFPVHGHQSHPTPRARRVDSRSMD